MLNFRIEKYIIDNQLFVKSDKLLLAISGGVDSVVLTEVLQELGYTIGLIHCNFSLRGQESDDDQRFIIDFAEKKNLPVFTEKYDTTAIAKERKLSIQETARQLRYAFFAQIAEKEHYNYILTAHHANDNAETSLKNWIKGAGLKGLRGILPQKEQIVRPMLGVTKAEILAYAEEKNILYREDSSNESDKYTRNFIRQNLYPSLEKINGNWVQSVNKNLELLRKTERILNYFLLDLKDEISQYDEKEGTFTYHLGLLRHYPHPEFLLYEMLQEYGFDPSQCEQMLQVTQSGKQFFSPKWVVFYNRGDLVLRKKNTAEQQEDILEVEILEGSTPIEKNNKIAFLDSEALQFPLSLRKWQEGDSFQPLGMGGKSQKLSDFFNNNKFSLLEKENVRLLVDSGGRICWVVGHRISEHAKVTEKTKKICKISTPCLS